MPSVREVDAAFDQNPRVVVLSKALNALSDEYNRKVAVAERVKAQMDAHSAALAQAEKDLEVQEKAQAVLLKLEEVWRKDFERGIEQVVTEGIELVFGRGSEFIIDTQVRAGASAITFEIETATSRDEMQDSQGGSMTQVVSFLLRIILVKASVPPMRQVIILDEPFEGVHQENVPLVAALVRKMVDDSNIQVIMVTQNVNYAEYADRVYDITKRKGVASARELKTA